MLIPRVPLLLLVGGLGTPQPAGGGRVDCVPALAPVGGVLPCGVGRYGMVVGSAGCAWLGAVRRTGAGLDVPVVPGSRAAFQGTAGRCSVGFIAHTLARERPRGRLRLGLALPERKRRDARLEELDAHLAPGVGRAHPL